MRIVPWLLLAAVGCARVDGGAIELSWRFRPASGGQTAFLDCAVGMPGTGPIDRIELDWEVGEASGSDSWRCTDGHGITGFDVPPGGALLAIKPICTGGPAAAGTYSAPPVEERLVSAGNTVNLGGVELVLVVTGCDLQPCICQ